ncbi:hypothetical protein ACFLZV_01960 [Candidatus Margulisiibacteriota bacterium]
MTTKNKLRRLLNETLLAKWYFNALTELSKYNFVYAEFINFPQLAKKALYDAWITRLIRLFEKNKRTFTFWTIWNSFPDKNPSEEKLLNEVSEKLKYIRNKTFFHIDKTKVGLSANVWKDAVIKPKDIDKALIIAHKFIAKKYKEAPGTDCAWKPSDFNAKEEISKIKKLYDW